MRKFAFVKNSVDMSNIPEDLEIIEDKVTELQKQANTTLNEYLLTKKTNPYYSQVVQNKRLQYTTALNEYHNYLFSDEVDNYIKISVK